VPVVTALRHTRGGRVAVHLDGRYSCTVSADLVAGESLFEGRELDEAEAAALRAAASAEQALSDAIRLLGHRARSRHELRERLLRKGHAATTVAVVLERLAGDGLLDDAAFARAYVADKRHLNGWGEERIRRGLRELGVAADVAEAALVQARSRNAIDAQGQSYDAAAGVAQGADATEVGDATDDELGRALAVLARRKREGAPPDVVRRRALAALRRRGFGSDVAWRALRQWLGEVGDDD